MYSIFCIPFGFDERHTAQKITLFETNIFLPSIKSRFVLMHWLCFVRLFETSAIPFITGRINSDVFGKMEIGL